jgi:hypothetical protein
MPRPSTFVCTSFDRVLVGRCKKLHEKRGCYGIAAGTELPACWSPDMATTRLFPHFTPLTSIPYRHYESCREAAHPQFLFQQYEHRWLCDPRFFLLSSRVARVNVTKISSNPISSHQCAGCPETRQSRTSIFDFGSGKTRECLRVNVDTGCVEQLTSFIHPLHKNSILKMSNTTQGFEDSINL